ncbi:MAG TPA: GGDEF domain-containing protein [Sphingomonas sp.]|nr:GGDEF domain-containing protein [Sphingomonas sp.]
MSTAIFVQVALFSTSATIALILTIAWHEFGRPPHAFTWAIGFALAATMWAIGLLPFYFPASRASVAAATCALAGFSSTFILLGFRQRVGAREWRMPLMIVATINALLAAILVFGGAPRLVQLIPLNLFNMMMFYLAARTLRGRRKGERVAEKFAEGGLLLLATFCLAVLIGLLSALAGVNRIEFDQLAAATLLILPGIIAGVGLFTIILLAADLADQARRLAATDIMTGLLNRRGFEDAAKALINSARHHDRALTLVLMDVDRFKEVNDLFGHPAGDRVLCAICDSLALGIGRRDILARFGGEEFSLILVDADIVTATSTVETLRREIASLDLNLPTPHQVTASFGAAALHDEDEGLASLLKRADEALYRSKADGRNRVTIA